MSYSLTDIRKFLSEAFSDEEIETFCFDYFSGVQRDFAAGMSRGDKIRRLLEYCQYHDQIPQLFSALQQSRPEQYQKQFGAAPPELLASGSPTVEPVGRFDASLLAYATLADGLLTNQQKSIRYYHQYVAALIFLGLIVAGTAVLLPEPIMPVLYKPIGVIGGLFICSTSSLLLKEIGSRREKAGVCETVKAYLNTLQQTQRPVEASAEERIEHFLWQVMEKTAVG